MELTRFRACGTGVKIVNIASVHVAVVHVFKSFVGIGYRKLCRWRAGRYMLVVVVTLISSSAAASSAVPAALIIVVEIIVVALGVCWWRWIHWWSGQQSCCCRLLSWPCMLLMVSVCVRTRSSVAAYALPKVEMEDSSADVRVAVDLSSLHSMMFMSYSYWAAGVAVDVSAMQMACSQKTLKAA